MIGGMAVVHITEGELAQSLGLILDRVQSGAEVIIERNAQPVAILRSTQAQRRKLSQIMSALPENSVARLDVDFAADVQEFIDRHREPLNPPESD